MDQIVKNHCEEITDRINHIHIAPFKNSDVPLFLISENYPGVWLEHVYDSVFYAKMYPEYSFVAKNTLRTFAKNQRQDGQLPCYIWDASRAQCKPEELIGYGQIQECVSFSKLCLMVCEQTGDKALLAEMYPVCVRWENWLRENRMTTGRGLVEMFVGYDTGHDNSGRLDGMAHKGNHWGKNGLCNAAVLPEEDGITPILPVDMNCNLYATDTALSKMASLLGKNEESALYEKRAKEVKANIFKHLFDEKDVFFYDVDKNGNKRRVRSSTVFHLFLERVLDPEDDAELIGEIYRRHIHNPEEFWTPYPFPAVAYNDPTAIPNKRPNSWGYYSQALIALRCTMWMDAYGWGEDFDTLCRAWQTQWTKYYPTLHFGQELDPITGEPSTCAPWYSSSMLFYLYCAKRLG